MTPIEFDLKPNLRSEAQLEKYCVRLAEASGVVSYKLKSVGNRGLTDRIFIFPTDGETVYVEFKKPIGYWRLSELQKRKIRALTAQRAFVYVCDSAHVFLDILRKHANGRPKFGD